MDYLLRTLELAQKGLGTTWPNPLVGCVIVKDGRVIAEGFHRKSGEDHAEADAIKNATESLRGATVYVNLEPCCHTNKKTPPCAQRLVEEGVKKVVIINLDPNPDVNGKGVDLLRSHGIEVEHGEHKAQGEALNEVFFHAQRTKLPFVHLKMASTLDGRIALPSGESQWITGESAREEVHRLRSRHQAIMVGGGTFRVDKPRLNVRLPEYEGPQPWKVVISRSGNLPSLPEDALVYSSPEEALKELFQRKIISVLLEGGPCLAGEMLKKNLIQRVTVFLNPSFLGAGPGSLGDFGLKKLQERPRLTQMKTQLFGDDLCVTGRIS